MLEPALVAASLIAVLASLGACACSLFAALRSRPAELLRRADELETAASGLRREVDDIRGQFARTSDQLQEAFRDIGRAQDRSDDAYRAAREELQSILTQGRGEIAMMLDQAEGLSEQLDRRKKSADQAERRRRQAEEKATADPDPAANGAGDMNDPAYWYQRARAQGMI